MSSSPLAPLHTDTSDPPKSVSSLPFNSLGILDEEEGREREDEAFINHASVFTGEIHPGAGGLEGGRGRKQRREGEMEKHGGKSKRERALLWKRLEEGDRARRRDQQDSKHGEVMHVAPP